MPAPVLNVPKLVTVFEHSNLPAPVNVTFPFVALNSASASYFPVLVIDIVPSTSDKPSAL